MKDIWGVKVRGCALPHASYSKAKKLGLGLGYRASPACVGRPTLWGGGGVVGKSRPIYSSGADPGFLKSGGGGARRGSNLGPNVKKPTYSGPKGGGAPSPRIRPCSSFVTMMKNRPLTDSNMRLKQKTSRYTLSVRNNIISLYILTDTKCLSGLWNGPLR